MKYLSIFLLCFIALTGNAQLTVSATATVAVPQCPAYNIYTGYGNQSIVLSATAD